jgi:hypothetical protein
VKELDDLNAKISKLVDQIRLNGNTLAKAGKLRELKEQRDKLEGIEELEIDVSSNWKVPYVRKTYLL